MQRIACTMLDMGACVDDSAHGHPQCHVWSLSQLHRAVVRFFCAQDAHAKSITNHHYISQTQRAGSIKLCASHTSEPLAKVVCQRSCSCRLPQVMYRLQMHGLAHSSPAAACILRTHATWCLHACLSLAWCLHANQACTHVLVQASLPACHLWLLRSRCIARCRQAQASHAEDSLHRGLIIPPRRLHTERRHHLRRWRRPLLQAQHLHATGKCCQCLVHAVKHALRR